MQVRRRPCKRRAPIRADTHRSSGPDECLPQGLRVAYFGETHGLVNVVGDSDRGCAGSKLVARRFYAASRHV
jgi:hypothetical protein